MRAEPGQAATTAGSVPFAPPARPDDPRWWSGSGRPPGGPWSVACWSRSARQVCWARIAARTPPSTRYLVLTADVAAGTTAPADHLGSVALDLPGELAAVREAEAETSSPLAATGLDELDLLRPSDLHEPGRFADPDAVEVALDLPSSWELLGALSRDTVEVLATDPAAGGTDRVAGGPSSTRVTSSRAASVRVDGDGPALGRGRRRGGSGGRCLGPRRGHARSAGTGRRGAGPMGDRFVLIRLARSHRPGPRTAAAHRGRGPDRLPKCLDPDEVRVLSGSQWRISALLVDAGLARVDRAVRSGVVIGPAVFVVDDGRTGRGWESPAPLRSSTSTSRRASSWRC